MEMLLTDLEHAVMLIIGMVWQVGWSLVLGFAISALLQTLVSKQGMQKALGRNGPKEIILATLAGAASSSCSYASAAVSRTLFKRGAALVPSLAFLFASTNLVIELGVVLLLLMGWQFMVGEWIGGVVLIIILAVLVKLTYPKKLVEEARTFPEAGGHNHDHGGMAEAPGSVWQKLGRRDTWVHASHSFVMDWQMLWKDIVLGFVIAGVLGAFVPDGVWQFLFVKGANPWIQVPANALLGPIVAMLSFVCSIGNVPLAAILWGSGVSFGGVLAFLFADLIVLPLLDVYRRTYGWKMAAYIGGVFYATMVLAALIMDLAFNGLGWIPARNPHAAAAMEHFSVNYTFFLNILFGLVAVAAVILAKRNPMRMAPRHCCGHSAAKAKAAEPVHAHHHH
ncbi:permease [Acidisoma cellulosilytica]|uniref:Permease n=1 Tax=Acidisoma cellulosilyticum TaxID=2802395 RepID=A0A963YY59_9PROT|nr:permease [Acidisoma cellulosilyticum]MCB8879351.1 permease [Acidisoma cellulosilyticum]